MDLDKKATKGHFVIAGFILGVVAALVTLGWYYGR